MGIRNRRDVVDDAVIRTQQVAVAAVMGQCRSTSFDLVERHQIQIFFVNFDRDPPDVQGGVRRVLVLRFQFVAFLGFRVTVDVVEGHDRVAPRELVRA